MGFLDIFKPKQIKLPVFKMYVLVRTDLAPIHRAVQGGHAVAEYMKSNYHCTPWNNGFMIYLGVANESELNRWEARFQAKGIEFSTFVEPDWGEPTKTAVAMCDTGEIVKGLPLLTLSDIKVTCTEFPPNKSF